MHTIAHRPVEPTRHTPGTSCCSLWLALCFLLAGFSSYSSPVFALEEVCAKVKIEIVQELSLERQAFEASMRITNGLDTLPLENIRVDVSFADENGASVLASSDPNNTSALFFIRNNSMEGISDVSGLGTVPPAGTADIKWLIIPAPGTGGELPGGKLYYIGATLTYTIGGEQTVTEVSPDYIYVKPTPLLRLDYFLPRTVIGDDAFTTGIEPPEPFTLGVRVSNDGFGSANNVRIESAQPRIIDNELGLLIDFRIIGSNVDDTPASPSLLIDFGDIPSNESVMGRWDMITTLSGEFTEFTAQFTHSDELGGQLTSLLDTVTTHTLLHDVLVDIPGRDAVRDFLAQDALLRVYESNGVDTVVADLSAGATLSAATRSGSQIRYDFTVPAEAGFLYARVPDPGNGTKRVVSAVRSDGKIIPLNNVWFSKTRTGSQPWQYWLNLFDFDTPGQYRLVMDEPVAIPQPPVLQFIPNRTTYEGHQLSFIVEASDPNGTTPVLTATGLPAGANFIDQGDGMGIFDWTPAEGQAGLYSISYQASDGVLNRSQLAQILVNPIGDTDGDGVSDAWELENFGTLDHDLSLDTDGDGVSDGDEYAQGTDPLGLDGPVAPMIDTPWFESEVTSTQPTLTVLNAQPPRPGTALLYEFEIYSDAGYGNLLEASGQLGEGVDRTRWTVSSTLPDNQWIYWRVRAYDGTLYTPWVYGNFFVNTANDAPGAFTLSYPVEGSQAPALPVLEVTNSTDPDGDAVSYLFEVFSDVGLNNRVAGSAAIPAGSSGRTRWPLSVPLGEGIYYWRVTAVDAPGLSTVSAVGTFTVNTINQPPATPSIAAPVNASGINTPDVTLSVNNAVDAEGDALVYQFELDTVSTFDGLGKRLSPLISEGAGTTQWPVSGLIEDATYFWRVRASDGMAGSPWVYGTFRVNAQNALPGSVVVINPGDGTWINRGEPVLSVLPTVDADVEILSYHFQVYRDRDLTDQVEAGLSTTGNWTVNVSLLDHGWYYWRVRAEDTSGAGPWSTVRAFYVNTSGIAFAADLNRDGAVDAADLGRMMSEWATSGSGADLTRDGDVGRYDMRQLLEQLYR